jgi:hypothetical protein
MASAKDLFVAPILSKDANAFIQRTHYSKKTVSNSQLHFGVFLNNRLEGVMQFGPSLDKRKIIGLVKDTKWNSFLELNRLAFSEKLPKNSESRALSIAFKLIKKSYPHIDWVISFADGTQCGDGTIYRAAGFVLTAINKSLNLVRLPSGDVIHKMTLESGPTRPRKELNGRSYYDITGGKYDLAKYVRETNGEVIPGFQLRYIYFLKPEAKARLTVPILPFDKIKEVGAKMYKGKRVTKANSEYPSESGGAVPTHALQQ